MNWCNISDECMSHAKRLIRSRLGLTLRIFVFLVESLKL